MRIFLGCFLALLLSSLTGTSTLADASTPATPSLGQIAVAPIDYDPTFRPIPCVRVSINGRAPVLFAIDTAYGNGAIAVASNAMSRLGLKPDATQPYGYLTTTVGDLKVVGSDGFGGSAATESTGVVIPVFDASFVQTVDGADVCGEIGMQFLSQIVNRLDFVKKTWTLYAANPNLDPPGAAVLPLIPDPDGSYSVKVDLGKEQSAEMTVSTRDVTTTIPLRIAGKLSPIAISSEFTMANGAMFIGPSLLLSGIGVASLRTGPAYVMVSPSGAGNVLGMDILRRFEVVFDVPHKRLLLTPGGMAARGDSFGATGITVTSEWIVSKVDSGSPAARAGVKVGDRIKAVDDHSLQGISTNSVPTILEGSSHTIVKLALSRKSKTLTVQFERGSRATEQKRALDGLSLTSTPHRSLTVVAIQPGCAADQAGIKVNDVVTNINGMSIGGTFQLNDLTAALAPRDLRIDVSRAGVAVDKAYALTPTGGKELGTDALAPADRPKGPSPTLVEDTGIHTIPFEYDVVTIQHLLVKASVNGAPPMTFVFDTGCLTTPLVLEPWAADELKLTTAGGNAAVQSLTLLDAGGNAGTGHPSIGARYRVKKAQVFDTDFLSVYGVKKVAGLIGAPLLAGMTARFDFDNNTITLAPIGTLKSPDGAVSVPVTYSQMGGATVSVGFGGKVEGDFIVDTGDSGITLPISIADSAGVKPIGASISSTLYSTEITPEVTVGVMHLGGMAVKDVTAQTFPDTTLFAGIGLNLLSRFNFSLDFPSTTGPRTSRLVLVPRKSADVLGDFGWSGVHGNPTLDGIKVRSVVDGSPALAAGLQSDDIILAIDGRAAKDVSPLFFDRLLNFGDPGSEVKLNVRRGGGQPFDMTFKRADKRKEASGRDAAFGLLLDKPVGDVFSVVYVAPGSPGDTAGLEAGDLVTAIEGRPTNGMTAEQLALMDTSTTLHLDVTRSGVARPLALVLEASAPK